MIPPAAGFRQDLALQDVKAKRPALGGTAFGQPAGGGMIPPPAWARRWRAAKIPQHVSLPNFRPADWRGRQGVG